MALSDRVGGGQTSVEQYAYFYLEDKVDLLKSYLVPKKISKIARTPFIAHFSPKGSTFDFAMIGVHTDPDLAEREILNLGKVFKYVEKFHQEKDTIILGDFNAGCTYLNLAPIDSPYLTLENMDDQEKTFIKDPLIFNWLIKNNSKTNTAHVNCPYDRIVVTGKVKKRVIPHSGKVFYFDKAWGLSYEETRKVSDHYPVEVKLSLDLVPTSFFFVKNCRSPRSAKDFPAKKTFWALKEILAAKNCQHLYDVLPEYEHIDLSGMGVTDLTPLKEFPNLTIFR
jgi:endonuclease/exonuclease/phosphatase family metal-dependent hydrolase